MLSGMGGAGFDPEVKKQIVSLTIKYLAAAEKKMDELLAAGKLDTYSLKEIMSEIRELIKANKGPASTIMAMSMPAQPQLPEEHDDRQDAIDASTEDPAQMEDLRASQQRFLERK